MATNEIRGPKRGRASACALMKRFFSVGLVGLATWFSGCTTVPESGRSQFIMISRGEETQMGFAAFEQIKKDEKISTDAAVNARIQRIGARVAEAVGREVPDAQWEFVVFESDTINAFALPGGKVGFYTGLIKLAESDDEIATVMGHEIAHVTSRHGAERVSQGQLAAIGGVAVALASDGSKNRNAYMLGYTALATLGTLGYSRLQETEADVIGLRFSSAAGYDPRAAASFWRKMKAANEGRGAPPIWLSTHPSTAARIAKLEELAPQFMATYEAAKARYE